MGISISLSTKQDYSYLFSGLSSSNGSSMGNLNFLSDYAAIKNGSYGKLMKAYYAESGSSSSSTASTIKNSTSKATTSTAADSSKTLAKIQESADGLKESADKLIEKGQNSLFKEKDITTTDENGVQTTTKGYDTDALYNAVTDFVKDYNSLLDSVDDSNSTSILNKSLSLVNMTAANEKLLADVGITINKDNSLSIDKETFLGADMNTVKTLFNGNSSYAYRVSAQTSMIDFAAERESSKANTYTINGTYGNTYSMGSIMDTLF